MQLHRNTQKRFYDPEFTYVVTVNIDAKTPFFKEKIFCELWIEELRLCKELKKFELYGFCLNYDHFHMVVNPCRKFNISKVMHSLKRNFSRDANKIIFSSTKDAMKKPEGEDPHLRHSFYGGEVGEPRLQKVDVFRYRELPRDWKYTSLNFPELLNNT